MSERAHPGDVVVRDEPDEGAYVVFVGEHRAGKAVYHLKGATRVFVHTEVESGYAGRGVGNTLVRFALDDIRSRGLKCVPVCPFFASFIDTHPEYQDIVDRELYDKIYRARAFRDQRAAE